jgi:hypothetical protein
MDYKEQIWEDLMDFKLPDPDQLKDGALSVNALAGILSDITNYFADLSQFEPNLLHKVKELKIDIEEQKRKKDQEFQYDFTERYPTIPESHKRNLDLQKGYVRNLLREKYDDLDQEILKLSKQLLMAEKRYNQLHRRMSLAKTVLDVGRSVLSALKEEVRNLNMI